MVDIAQLAAAHAQPMPAPEPAWVTGEPVTGIILAGGRSHRMGRDKAWAELAGRPLIAWVLDALRAVTDQQMVVARDEAQVASLSGLGLPVAVDHFPARGPLTGIHAGLKASETDLAVVVACDLPLVRPALLTYLIGAIGTWHAAVPYMDEGELPASFRAAVPARQAGLQPLMAAYRRRCVAPLEKLLAAGAVPTTALIAIVRARVVPPAQWREVDPDGRSFFNVNTHEDLISAARILAQP